jgi:hypothetical protein
MKKFNLYWGDTGSLSSGSPHPADYVIDGRFQDSLPEEDAQDIEKLRVGEKHVDPDGDTWERIA